MRWREPHAAAGTGQVAHHIAQHPPAPPLPTSSVALSIDQVQVWLGGRMVLHDVDLQVRRGELVGLIGPNGAGKTTVLRSVLGLVPLTQGSVTVHHRLGDSSARVGYVPQRHDFAWDYPISIQEAVVAARTPYRSWWRRTGIPDVVAAATALHRVGLYELRHRPVGELSGGQRQRVLIARALAVEPSVLLLDEPMTGLDVPSQDSLHSLFSDLAAEGEALLMTTHDIPSALTLCDRLLLLQGTVVAAGPPADLGDPQLWMRTFGVGPESSLVSVVQACVPRPSSRPHGHKVLL